MLLSSYFFYVIVHRRWARRQHKYWSLLLSLTAESLLKKQTIYAAFRATHRLGKLFFLWKDWFGRWSGNSPDLSPTKNRETIMKEHVKNVLFDSSKERQAVFLTAFNMSDYSKQNLCGIKCWGTGFYLFDFMKTSNRKSIQKCLYYILICL